MNKRQCSLLFALALVTPLEVAGRKQRAEGKRRPKNLRSLSDAIQTRVIGGGDTQEDRYPYYVALMRKSGALICGGTLIAPDVVLTAAHCFEEDLDYAVIGKYLRKESQGGSIEVRQIKDMHLHPDFNYEGRRFDQMIVTLKSPSTYPYLKNINLDGNLPAVGGVDVTIIGFGATDVDGSRPDVLQEVNSTVVPNDICAVLRDEETDFGSLIRDDHLCLSGPNDQGGQCYGDSGGAQLLLGATADLDVLVGVVSWGVNCGMNGFPSVGSRTSASTFIKEKTCEESLVPPDVLCAASVPIESVSSNSSNSVQDEISGSTGEFALENGLAGCGAPFESCAQDWECCSSRCVRRMCRTSISDSRLPLSGNRGGAAAKSSAPEN